MESILALFLVKVKLVTIRLVNKHLLSFHKTICFQCLQVLHLPRSFLLDNNHDYQQDNIQNQCIRHVRDISQHTCDDSERVLYVACRFHAASSSRHTHTVQTQDLNKMHIMNEQIFLHFFNVLKIFLKFLILRACYKIIFEDS